MNRPISVFGCDGVFLPLEGDLTLSVILSKAFLLAEDTKIKGPTILSQIRRQGGETLSLEVPAHGSRLVSLRVVRD